MYVAVAGVMLRFGPPWRSFDPAKSALCSALCVISFVSPAEAGKLDDAGRATRSGSSSSSSDDDDDDDDALDTEDACDDECAEFVAQLLFSPWTVPRSLMLSERQEALWYDDFPYARSRGYVGLRYSPAMVDGFQIDDREPLTVGPGELDGQRWAAQFAADVGTSLDGVGRGGITARLLTPVPIEFEASFLGFVEDDAGTTDWAGIGAVRLNWRFAQSQNVQFRSGLAYQHWLEDHEPRAAVPLSAEERSQPGFDLSYGFDAFVGKPFVLSAEGHAGMLGSAFAWQGRASFGALFGPVEWMLGYHEVNIGGVSLGGPFTGVRGYL